MPTLHLSAIVAVVVTAYLAIDHELTQVIQAIQDWGN